jgi:hypothetical protein
MIFKFNKKVFPKKQKTPLNDPNLSFNKEYEGEWEKSLFPGHVRFKNNIGKMDSFHKSFLIFLKEEHDKQFENKMEEFLKGGRPHEK